MARKRTHSPEVLAETQRKRNLALAERLAGKPQYQIAAEQGWSKQAVSLYIKEAIADITRENAEEYLELELQRLDAMWAAIWEQIVAPASDEERKGQTWKIDRALAIMEQRAKLTGTYKAAELRAVADAKSGMSAEKASMIGRLFDAIEAISEATEAEDEAADESEPAE
jgi:hypothetical protein